MHLFYIATMLLYVNFIYIQGREDEGKEFYEKLLIVAVIYPAMYDNTQLYKTGWRAYFSEP